MKKVMYPNLDDYDLSDYEELKGDILYKINGGAEIENSVEAQAQAQEGDTVTRNDGTTHTLTKGDITWAQNQVSNNGGGSSGGSANVSAGNETAIAGGDVSAGTGNPSGQGNAGSGGSLSSSSSNPKSTQEATRKILGESKKESELVIGWYESGETNLKKLANGGKEPEGNQIISRNSNTEIDLDKEYNARDYKGKHIMTVHYEDKDGFEKCANCYLTVGKYGAAGAPVYDGIGLTNDRGDVIHILKDDKSISKYAGTLNPSVVDNTLEAGLHYLNNYGSPVKLGENVVQDIKSANSKNVHYNNIVSGKTDSWYGNYSLDMEGDDCQDLARDYFLGRTRIDYFITTHDDYSEVKFVSSAGDGFWDILKDADNAGPKNEIPGCTPYPFVPNTWTETFVNPQKMNWQ